ncbi:MAG: hypothetical protein ACOC80_05915 [Petrotogales bacterium]
MLAYGKLGPSSNELNPVIRDQIKSLKMGELVENEYEVWGFVIDKNTVNASLDPSTIQYKIDAGC